MIKKELHNLNKIHKFIVIDDRAKSTQNLMVYDDKFYKEIAKGYFKLIIPLETVVSS